MFKFQTHLGRIFILPVQTVDHLGKVSEETLHLVWPVHIRCLNTRSFISFPEPIWLLREMGVLVASIVFDPKPLEPR